MPAGAQSQPFNSPYRALRLPQSPHATPPHGPAAALVLGCLHLLLVTSLTTEVPRWRARTSNRTQRPPSTARSTRSPTLPTSACPCLTTLAAILVKARQNPGQFLHQSREEGKHAEKLMKAESMRWPVSSSKIPRNQILRTGRRSWTSGVSVTLGSVESVATGAARTGYW